MNDSHANGPITRRSALMLAIAGVQAQSQTGGKSMGCPPIIHFEIGCRDQARTGDFFAKLFNWKIQANGPASMIDTGSAKGIPGHITSLGHEPHHYTTFYVEVDDVAAYLEKVKELGGKALVGPITIPTGTFAWFQDPEGNIIGLLKPAA